MKYQILHEFRHHGGDLLSLNWEKFADNSKGLWKNCQDGATLLVEATAWAFEANLSVPADKLVTQNTFKHFLPMFQFTQSIHANNVQMQHITFTDTRERAMLQTHKCVLRATSALRAWTMARFVATDISMVPHVYNTLMVYIDQ